MDHATQELRALTLWGTVSNEIAGFGGGADARVNWQTTISAIGRELPNPDPHAEAVLWHRLGYVALVMGDVRTKAQEAFTLMYERARELEDGRLRAMAAIGLSHVHDTLGDRHRSLELAKEAELLAKDAGDDRLLALALNMKAQFFKENGANDLAHDLFASIGEIAERLGDTELLMAAYIGRGRTTSMARPFSAMACYEQAIQMAKESGDLYSLILCYNNLADWKINTGAYEEAIELREQCLRLSERLQWSEGKGRALIGIAKARTLMGDLDAARRLLDKGFPAALGTGDLEGELHASLNLAFLYVQTGDVPRASQMYRDVLDRSLAAPDHSCAVFAQRALAMLANGETPKCAILPDTPLTRELTDDELAMAVGGAQQLAMNYPTGDRKW
jgi:tetratricopeptide (TPR) repeat protein